MSNEHKTLAWVFVAVLVVGALIYVAATKTSEAEAQHVYEQQLRACVQGNPLRESVMLAISTAADTAAGGEARAQYTKARNHMLAQPFIRPDGSKECERAVTHP